LSFQSRECIAQFWGVFLLSLAVTASACAERPEDRAADSGTTRAADSVNTIAARAAIDSLRGVWERSVEAGDVATMSTLLADSAVMVQPGSADWNAMSAAAAGAPFPPGATIDITPIEVRVLGPEWAYEFGTSVVKYMPPGARDERTLTDTYLILFRKTAEGWKVFREVASSKAPPPATPAPAPER